MTRAVSALTEPTDKTRDDETRVIDVLAKMNEILVRAYLNDPPGQTVEGTLL